MTLRVLGCSGSIAAGCRTTAFLLDDDVLIDAGTGVGDLPLDALARIDHVLISHSHLDHVLSIALLADSVMRRREAEGRGPIQVHALPETLAALRDHLFNGVIWPDFTRLPSAQSPVLQFVPFATGEVLTGLGRKGRRVEVLSAAHTVPAVGFAVEGAAGWWVYTGDTGPNPALWERLRSMTVAHLVIETAFSDAERHLARHQPAPVPGRAGPRTGPARRLRRSAHITHIKPGEQAAVMAEIAQLATAHRVQPLSIGDEMALD